MLFNNRKRKNIPVDELKNMINDVIKNSHDNAKDHRESVAMILETVLLRTKNYHGFVYLSDNDETRRRYI